MKTLFSLKLPKGHRVHENGVLVDSRDDESLLSNLSISTLPLQLNSATTKNLQALSPVQHHTQLKGVGGTGCCSPVTSFPIMLY